MLYLKNANGELKELILNASIATKATQDASGNEITSTYATKTSDNAKLPLAGGTMTGTLTVPTAVISTRLNIPTSAPSSPVNGDIWIE